MANLNSNTWHNRKWTQNSHHHIIT